MPADDHFGHGSPSCGTRSAAQRDRDHRSDQHHRGHQDGPQAHAIGLEDGRFTIQAAGAQGVCVVNLQDAVFLHDAKEHEEAKDRINVQRLVQHDHGDQRERQR